jgi:hypothetical protein
MNYTTLLENTKSTHNRDHTIEVERTNANLDDMDADITGGYENEDFIARFAAYVGGGLEDEDSDDIVPVTDQVDGGAEEDNDVQSDNDLLVPIDDERDDEPSGPVPVDAQDNQTTGGDAEPDIFVDIKDESSESDQEPGQEPNSKQIEDNMGTPTSESPETETEDFSALNEVLGKYKEFVYN